MFGTGLRNLTVGRPTVSPELRALHGTEIIVPVLHRAVDSETVKHIAGQITGVRESDDRLISVDVRLEDGEEIVLTIRVP